MSGHNHALRCVAPAIPALLLLVSCVYPPHGDPATRDDDVREAVFRYQMNIWRQEAPREGLSVYFLDISGKGADPSDAFMKRFAGYTPPVEKASQCVVTNLLAGVTDRQSGKPGILFTAGAITWINASEVEVSGGYYQNGKSSSVDIYVLKWSDGKWNVIDDHVQTMAYNTSAPLFFKIFAAESKRMRID